MRTAKCYTEQGMYDHSGCDLSGFEAILDPGCPEKVNKLPKSLKSMQTKKMRSAKSWTERGVFMTILDAICVT